MLLEEFKTLVDELAKINEDAEVQPEHNDEPAKEKHEEKSEESSDARASIRKAIEPSVTIAKSIIAAIGKTTENNCNNSKKMKDQEQQIKNFEKSARGACEQVVVAVEGNNFVPDKFNSSPRAYKIIHNNNSRDMDAVKLSLAIITFYNSLG